MLQSFLWAWIFVHFWWPVSGMDGLFSPVRQVFFFRDGVRVRVFETHDPGGAQKGSNILSERAHPYGKMVAGIRARPVFKIFFADIDHDRTRELILGVTRNIFGKPYRRVYVYDVTGHSFIPRWLGSRLSYRLIDFDVVMYKGMFGIRSRELHFGTVYEGFYLWDQWGFRTISLVEVGKHE